MMLTLLPRLQVS